jgi:hypothetical protein
VDRNHWFTTARLGFGVGGGVALSLDDEGGVPGGTEATGECGGAVVSASFRADAGFGPFGAEYERGVFRNLTSQIIDKFTEKSPTGDWDFGGAHGSVSGGVQITLYQGW